MAKEKETERSTETALAIANHRLQDDELAEVSTLEDAVALLNSYDAQIEDFSEYGSGFDILDDKDKLLAKPFLVLEWRFHPSKEFGGEFVSALVMTKANEKYIINDGSTGIAKQLAAITARREQKGHPTPTKGLTVGKGLRKSTYEASNPDGSPVLNRDGEPLMGTTYYLA